MSATFHTHIGPRGVRALPLAAGTNEGGHYFRYIFTLLTGLLTDDGYLVFVTQFLEAETVFYTKSCSYFTD